MKAQKSCSQVKILGLAPHLKPNLLAFNDVSFSPCVRDPDDGGVPLLAHLVDGLLLMVVVVGDVVDGDANVDVVVLVVDRT